MKINKFKKGIKKVVPDTFIKIYKLKKEAHRIHSNERLTEEEEIREFANWFNEKTGETLDLESPKTFNQKIQYLKFCDSTPLKGKLADKYEVREYVASVIGKKYLVPCLGVYDSTDQIDFAELPNRFVLKATHGCGWNIIVSDKKKLNIMLARGMLAAWLKLDYSYSNGFEKHYHYCTPRIIAEQYLDDVASGSLDDYKVYCFNSGEPIILVCRDRFGDDNVPMTSYYDKDWNKLFTDKGHRTFTCPRPPHLDEMLRLSELLSRGFPFVRVDWYESKHGLLFGELTFTSGSGLEDFDPPIWNLELGNRIDISRIRH